MTDTAFEGWALVELMGHRRRPGYVKQVEQYGTVMLQVDVPCGKDDHVTEFYGGAALYCVTPMDEEVIRDEAATLTDPRPVRPRSYRDPDQPSLPRLGEQESDHDDYGFDDDDMG